MAKRSREAVDGFRPALKVMTRDLAGDIEIRVRDNGTGIPTELRDKLFQPFFTTKPTGEGTGLGLSIAYDIVTQQHAGRVHRIYDPPAPQPVGRAFTALIGLPRRCRHRRSAPEQEGGGV